MKTLNQTHKYAIQGLLHNNKTTAEIAEILRLNEEDVKIYIDGELRGLQEVVAKVQSEKQELSQTVENQQQTIKDQEETIRALRSQIPTPADPKEIIKAKNQMITKTGNDKSGVAIMTKGASERGDENRKRLTNQVTRTTSGNLYRLSDGKKLMKGDKIKEE